MPDETPSIFDPGADFRVSAAPVRDGVRAVTLSGSLDFSAVEPVWSRLRQLVAGTSVLALDTSRVEFCDAAGLRLLIRLHEQGSAEGCQVVVCAASPMVDWLLRLMRLAATFDYPPATQPDGET
ncbi:STAS domain-containing protein [Actinoplanes sp. NPDC051346]|uniref:STAS domain-containing protein n=1 Tax=Actinoplanes sp. NPDC051346 TaxID=3155048 RepID=UPI00342707EF